MRNNRKCSGKQSGLMKLYQNKEWLYQKYWEEGLSSTDIAAIFGCSCQSILRWMKKLGIERRSRTPHTKRAKQKMGFQREQHPCWKGGQSINGGYVRVLMREHPAASSSGYVSRARLIAERVLGRYLKPGETVHHINENKQDDRNCNLLICEHALHSFLHSQLRKIKQGKPLSKLYHHNKNWLIEKYQKERLSMDEIANQCRVSRRVIRDWLRKFGIPRRKPIGKS